MAADPREVSDFFLNSQQKIDDPFADFAWFRQHQPVFYYPPLNEWFVFDFDTVLGLFGDARLGNGLGAMLDSAPASMRDQLQQVGVYLNRFIVLKDGDEHVHLRKYLSRAFSADVISGLKSQIEQVTNELLDRVQGQGRMDACGDFALLLPVYVLCDFLGVPEQDRDRLVQWSADFVDFFNIQPPTVDTSQRLVKSGLELAAYTKGLLADRRAHPRQDFLGILVACQSEPDGLTDDEIVGNTMMVLVAGHISVRNLIGNTIWLLLTHPDQRARLQADPTLLRGAIEESLRYETPVSMLARIALEDFELQGQAIRQGQLVQLSLASANRDEKHFPHGDTFDITRPPGRILSFGYGAHGCLGAHLGREEAYIALEALFRRMPNLQLDASRPIQWHRDAGNRGPLVLPVTF